MLGLVLLLAGCAPAKSALPTPPGARAGAALGIGSGAASEARTAGAPEARTAAAAGATVRVAAYNIKHGRGMDDRVDLPRVADVLRSLDADVIALQEVDDRTERTDRVDQVAVLAQLLGYRGFHGPHRPYQGGYYGNAILTRLPVTEIRVHPIPPASGSALAVLEVQVDAGGGGRLSVVSVHLAGTTEERAAQADTLTRLFGSTSHPVVLAGDFNGRPDGPVLRRLAQAWQRLPKTGSPYSYPADVPDREIDFLMVRRGDAVEARSHRVAPEAVASDHRPIVADLVLEPDPSFP